MYVQTLTISRLLTIAVVAAASTVTAAAQAPPSTTPESAGAAPSRIEVSSTDQGGQPQTRQGAIEQQQAAKVPQLHPITPSKGERIFANFDRLVQGGQLKWHPFFDNAYSGGGFTLGVGHASYVSGYNYIDPRVSYSFKGYKRAEIEFVAPRLFKRRGYLSVLGGWREATQVGFYGVGNDTSTDDRTNYLFQQPYASALLTVFPTRNVFMLRGGAEFSRWSQKPGEGASPSVETRYTPETLPGLGANVKYLHSEGTVGIDWRTSPGYSRRGGFYGITLHDYRDRDDAFGFRLIEYEAVQHVPILRDTWVLSFRGRVQNVKDKDDETTPFFMLPALGGGSSLRGYSSWRFRDQNSLLLQAEWRIIVNRYLDLAFFYDAGKVAPRTEDLDFKHLKDDFGVGVRFHGPFSTPLRVELAKSREGLVFVFASSAAF
jgi:hypothetical protein